MPDLIARLRAAGCVYAEEEAALLQAEARSVNELEQWAQRRVAGEPLEYLLGWVAFDGLRVALDAAVFIPRQRSVLLVEIAARALAATGGDVPVVLDLCCGSGALGLAIARRHRDAPPVERTGDGDPRAVVLHAVDDDPVAVSCAARNLTPVGGTAHLGDLDAPLPGDLRGRAEVIVANVPYVPTGQVALMPIDSRDHEPRSTVDGGTDGLDVLRRVAALAPTWLRPSGLVVCEIAPEQADAASATFSAAGLGPQVHHDEEREATAISGTLRRP